MGETEKSPLRKVMDIQKLQFELDNKKKAMARISKDVRSLSQRIPQLIRELEL